MFSKKMVCLQKNPMLFRAQINPGKNQSVSVILTHKQIVALTSRNRYTDLRSL